MLQLGLFTVGATATGCLYFMDTTNVANPRGLDAVAVLHLLLRTLAIIAMVLLVLVTGARKTNRFTEAAVRSCANKFGRSMSTSFVACGGLRTQSADPPQR